MTDQTTPITDDDRRKARAWAEKWTAANGMPEKNAAARVILATVPAPPKSLADELRDVADQADGIYDLTDGEALDSVAGYIATTARALADRVEAVEKELSGYKRDYAECQRELIASEVDLVEAQRERDEARAEVDRLNAELSAWMKVNQALTDQHETTVAEHDEARAEVERLTRERDAAQEVSFLEEEAVGLSYWLADALGEDIDDQSDETLTDTVQRLVNKKLGYPDFRAFLGMPPATALPDSADLPEPDETVMPGDCIGWDVGEDLLVQYAPRTNTVALEDFYGHGIRIAPDDARSIAYALLAAADYAERI